MTHKQLREGLTKLNFNVIGEFQCKGFFDYVFIKYINGGMNKGRPDEDDLKKAKDFALQLMDSVK